MQYVKYPRFFLGNCARFKNKLSHAIKRVNNDTLKCKFRVDLETVKVFI